MILTIPDVLSAEEVAAARQLLDEAEWVDGKVTAGYQSSKAKNNLQIAQDHPAAKKIGEVILSALGRCPLFLSSALPLKVFPPLFNRYQGGQSFGTHVDNAIRQVPGTPHRVRTDLSATLFLCDPKEYEGGELCVEDIYGVHSIKLPAGHMALYPATSLHHVKPVNLGIRTCSFFWIQSLVRDDGQRTLLFDLDNSIQKISRDYPEDPVGISLTGIYNNLLRQWAEMG